MSDPDIAALRGRLSVVVDRIDELARKIGPDIEEIGQLRLEMWKLHNELSRHESSNVPDQGAPAAP